MHTIGVYVQTGAVFTKRIQSWEVEDNVENCGVRRLGGGWEVIQRRVTLSERAVRGKEQSQESEQ